jgi:hypothetical protein
MITAVELPIIEQRIAAAKTKYKYKGIGIDPENITCTVEELITWARARGYPLEHSPSVDAYILKW